MSKKLSNVFKYVFLSFLSVISIFPFYWMIVAATNKSVDVTKGTLVPGDYFFENLQAVLESSLQYVNAYKNSLVIAVCTTIFAMIVSSAAGYALEDGTPLNISDKDQKWVGLSDTFAF